MKLALFLLTFAALADDAPPSPFFDRGARPFECCTYRRWQALHSAGVFAAPDGGRKIARRKAGEWVTALTGETRFIPIPITLRGERGYVLHYESSRKFWIHGRIPHEDLALDRQGGPGTEWWAKVRTANGLTGGVRAKYPFDNQDSCA